MSRGISSRLAWGVFALSLALYGGGLALLVLNAGTPAHVTYGTRYSEAFTGLAFLAFPAVGALVLSRRPGNPVGWLMLAMGPILGASGVAWEWGVYALLTNPGFPGGVVASWIAGWVWVPGFATAATFLLLVFPDGSLPSRRWLPVAWVTGVVIGVATIGFAFAPGALEEAPLRIQNPYGLGEFGEVFQTMFLLAPVLFLVSAASLVVRYRRSGAEQREQLKWLAYAAAVVALGFLLVFLVSLPRLMSGFERTIPTWLAVLQDIVTLSAAGIPIAIGFAIHKYRLYDIDVVIKKTLVYGLLTATLVGVYAIGVIGLGATARAVTGQESNSLVVAISTLAVAALFRPVRWRIQAIIDRRFYRQRYDAVRTLEAFSARLREEIDLDSLTGELVGVVRDTMQPSRASLWLGSTEAGP
jgi:hypothetical protein